MNQNSHVTRTDLVELIEGTGDSTKTQLIGEHIHRCPECRKLLDSLTASSAIWERAPKLLKSGLSMQTDCWDFSGDQWQYPIDDLLEQPAHPELLGRLGKYDVEREVGRGGMGVVLKAYDGELHRVVAIKVLAPHVASNATARKRFAQEAIAAAAVFHPNVIPIHGVNHEGKTPYIVMPFIDGPSLQTLVEQNGSLTEIEVVRIGLQISAGLAAAHAQGLVHRDIKPANVLVEPSVNRVMITDFGLARAVDDASMTRTGWLAGTPNYMSPQQARGERTDPRNDLFSFGSLMYFLATGRLPFRAESPLGVLHRIQNSEPIAVHRLNHQISTTLSDIIKGLQMKSLEARFQSAVEVHSLLEKHLAYLHQPESRRPPKVKCSQKSPYAQCFWKSATGMVAVALALATAYLATSKPSEHQLLYRSVTQKSVIHDAAPGVRGTIGEEAQAESVRLVSRAKLEFCHGHFESAEELCQKALLANPMNDEAATNLGYFLAAQGRHDEAVPWHERAAQSADFQAIGNYNLACYHSQKMQPDLAISFLNKSIGQGLVNFLSIRDIEADPDLRNVRNDQRFIAAVESLRR